MLQVYVEVGEIRGVAMSPVQYFGCTVYCLSGQSDIFSLTHFTLSTTTYETSSSSLLHWTVTTMINPVFCSIVNGSSMEQQQQQEDNKVLCENEPRILGQILEDLEHYRNEFGPYDLKVAETLSSLGLIRQHMQRNIPEALYCHNEALKIYRANDCKPFLLAATLNDLGKCYEMSLENERALEYYNEAIVILQNHVDDKKFLIATVERAIARLSRV